MSLEPGETFPGYRSAPLGGNDGRWEELCGGDPWRGSLGTPKVQGFCSDPQNLPWGGGRTGKGNGSTGGGEDYLIQPRILVPLAKGLETVAISSISVALMVGEATFAKILPSAF